MFRSTPAAAPVTVPLRFKGAPISIPVVDVPIVIPAVAPVAIVARVIVAEVTGPVTVKASPAPVTAAELSEAWAAATLELSIAPIDKAAAAPPSTVASSS